MARKRRRKPKVRWPDVRTAPETWSYAEARGVSINPILTGIGLHPRSISDEDWVFSCERDVAENGLAQFLTDLLHILRLTIPTYLGPPQPVGDYPQRLSKGTFPCRTWRIPVTGIGRTTTGTRPWSADCSAIRSMSGSGHFPPWCRTSSGSQPVSRWSRSRVGQYLVNVLYQLKKSFDSITRTE